MGQTIRKREGVEWGETEREGERELNKERAPDISESFVPDIS